MTGPTGIRTDGTAAGPESAGTAATRLAGSPTDETRIAGDPAVTRLTASDDATAPTIIGSPTSADPATTLQALVGRTIGGCVIDDLLGRGGMGAVYRARQVSLGRTVALKVMLPGRGNDPQFAERFVREARLVASLNHPNVVQVYDAGTDAGMLYLVMEHIDGRTIGQVIARQRPLPVPVVLALLRQAADGLQAAHARGLVHRDIKPDNLMVDGDGRLRVMDFGLARPSGDGQESGLTASGMILGTPNYISPEGARGSETDIRSDLYSLGITAWQMLVGRLPFSGPTPVQVMVQHLEVTPPDAATASGCPRVIADLVARLLAKDPARRPATPMELSQAVAEVERAVCGGPVRLGWRDEQLIGLNVAPLRAPRRSRLPAAAVAILIAASAAAMWVLWPHPAAPAAAVADVQPIPAAATPIEASPAVDTPPDLAVSPSDTLAATDTVATDEAAIAPVQDADAAVAPPLMSTAAPGTATQNITPPPPAHAPVAPTVPASVLGEIARDPAPAPPTVAYTTHAVPIDDPLPSLFASRLPASLAVTTIPDAAEVLIDGVTRGRTPLLLRDLAAGQHEVHLRLPGRLDDRQIVVLPPGRVVRLSNPLPAPARLTLHGLTTGTRVVVAGLPYSAGMALPVGEVGVSVQADPARHYRLMLEPGDNHAAIAH